jgi:hypothetical protein
MKLCFVAVTSVLTLLGLAHTALAADTSDVSAKPNISITVSPAKSALELNPGDNYIGKFKIINTGAKSFDFKLSVSPYSVVDVNYEQDMDNDKPRTQISRWITFEQDEYYLEAGDSIDIKYTVKVPADAPAGGQYAVILASTAGKSKGTETSSIDTVQRVGMLVYSTVQGNTREAGKVKQLDIPTWYFNPPLQVRSLVANTGNVDFNASYNLTIKTLFGREVFTKSEEHSILPDTERSVVLVWDKAPAIGIFKVTETVTVLPGRAQAETKTETRLVIMIPFFIVIILAILVPLSLAALGMTIYRRIKTRNQWRGYRRRKANEASNISKIKNNTNNTNKEKM